MKPEYCDYCGIELISGIGRRWLSNGTIICDECTQYNRHLKDLPGVKRRIVWDLFIPRWYYYFD